MQPRHTAEAVRRTTDKAVKTEARHQGILFYLTQEHAKKLNDKIIITGKQMKDCGRKEA